MTDINVIKIFGKSGCEQRDVINSALEIQRELLIKDELLKKGITRPEHGLLFSRYSEKDVMECLKEGGAVYLASCGGEPAGYLLTASPDLFFKKCGDAKLEWPDAGLKDRFEAAISNRDFVFMGQIGISVKYHGKGVADAIVKTIEEDKKGRLLLGYIALSPIDNIRSRTFFTKRGYLCVAKARFPEYAGIKDFVADIVVKGC